jgi:signal transduction histidine kinase
MQRDTVIIKPKVNLAISLVMLPMLIVFFKPSFWEIFGFFVVDVISYAILMPLDIPLFQRYFPLTRLFFPVIQPELYEVSDFKERVRLYHTMAQFPLKRSIYILAISFIKVMPAFAYGLWAWGDRYSALEIILKGFVVCAFTFSYGVGAAFLGYHNQMTSTLEAVHRKSNWSDVFKAINPLPDKALFHRFEVIAILGVLVFWLGMICLIPFEEPSSPWFALLQILYLSAFGFYFMAQIYGASRHQIMQGLESLIAFHSGPSKQLDPRGLPLSTNPTLAFYQKTVNDMIERNVASEQEIHRWILRKAEDSRYLQLGRVTGLFIHDLATPLTIMGLSLSQLEDQPSDRAVTHRYVERLRFCLQQITDFIGNLRLSIRDSAVNARQASPYLAHQAALRMLSYLHEREIYNKLKFECLIDPELRVSFPQPELNQVIQNLYSNAVTNLLQNKVENPSLSMQVVVKGMDRAELLVRDNGTGLSLKNFEFITEEAERLPGKEGIGLKLTKRLVELYGGSLSLIESSEGHGSAFVINLPLVTMGANPESPALTPTDESKNALVGPEMPLVGISRTPVEVPREA